MFSTHHSSINQLWASLLIEELVRSGINHVCLAPGSRSTPLVIALEQHPELQLHHHFDERGLGFLALGLAKGLAAAAANQPVAIITTSGTAVANLYPAVIEASQTGLPLLLISADRPPRLHHCGANQSINQQGIFANYPQHSLYLQPPSQEQGADQLLRQLATAVAASTANPGVVHINCMFDEPLYPAGNNEDFSVYLSSIETWLSSDQRYPVEDPVSPALMTALPNPDQWQQFVAEPGFIVVGALPDRISAATVKTLAKALGWPIIADIQSQLKTDPDCLGAAELLLSSPEGLQQLSQARLLLQLGGRLVSKRLQAFIEGHDWTAFWLVNPGDQPLAPGRNQTRFFSAAIKDWCHQQLQTLDQLSALPQQTALNRSLFTQQSQVTKQLARKFSLESHPQLSELAVCYQLLANSPEASWLLAGNSLGIRILELIGAALKSKPQLFANRGASGIEGLVSTALGCSLASQQPGTLLLGDYSLLYDLNALALLSKHPLPLLIVVLNNDGGGIFRMLPIADEALRQRHYQRPHGLSFEHACTMFQIRYYHPLSLADFILHYQKSLQTNGPCLIEISADALITEQQIRALTAD